MNVALKPLIAPSLKASFAVTSPPACPHAPKNAKRIPRPANFANLEEDSPRLPTTSPIPSNVTAIPTIAQGPSDSCKKRNATMAAIAGAVDIMSELMRAPIYSYDLNRNESPKTKPRIPLRNRYASWDVERLIGMRKTKSVIARSTAARMSLVTFTFTDPTRREASANEIELPDQQKAVARALSSPINVTSPQFRRRWIADLEMSIWFGSRGIHTVVRESLCLHPRPCSPSQGLQQILLRAIA